MNSMREAAMEKAIELHRGAGVSAEELVATAEAIRRYCDGDFEDKTLPLNLSSLLTVNGNVTINGEINLPS